MPKKLVAFRDPNGGILVTREDTLPIPGTLFVIGSQVVDSTGGSALGMIHERVMPAKQDGTYYVTGLDEEAPLFPVSFQNVGPARLDAQAYLQRA